ncbi:hypothetical protein [Streptomyces sp. BF23-18]|uniref:hypothetical protein n=1 Tax=unclassified Streptomyces TaxID=2593676 RepID=UPI0034E5F410
MAIRDRLRVSRKVVLLACTALTLTTMVGCSPPERPLVAIYAAQGGEVRALLRACPNSAVTSMTLMRMDGKESAGAATQGVEYWVGAPPEPLKGEQDISLVSLPADWGASRLGTGELTAGAFYSLNFTSGHDDSVDYHGIGGFRTSDIEKLDPGDVWADGKSMSLKEFRKKADGSC